MPQLLTGFSLADIADRHWGKLVDILKRLKRAGLDAIAEAPVDRLHDAEDALQACEAAGLPVRCLSLQSPIEGDGRSSWLIHLRDLREEVSGHRHRQPAVARAVDRRADDGV